MTYLELAKKILQQKKTPLTANEIWKLAKEEGYDKLLKRVGKTPSSTLRGQLYVKSKPGKVSQFKQTSSKPVKFFLAE